MNIVCIICSELLAQSDEVFHTPCGHVFHLHCLTQWLDRSKTCPQCREKVSQRKIHRLYFNFSSSDVVESNSSSMQDRINNLKFQILLKEKDITYFTSKSITLEKQNAGLRKEVQKVENEACQKDSAIHALKEQTKFFKQRSQECDNLRKEIVQLKKKIDELRPIQVLLHATVSDVNEMVKRTRDPVTLIKYIYVMKKELISTINKCKQLRITVKRLQEELTKAGVRPGSVLEEHSKMMQLEEELIFSECRNISLRERVNELEKVLGITENTNSTLKVRRPENINDISKDSTIRKITKMGNNNIDRMHKSSTSNKKAKDKTPTKDTTISEGEISKLQLKDTSIGIMEGGTTRSILISDSPSVPKRSRISIGRKENDDIAGFNKSDDKCTDYTLNPKSKKIRDVNKKKVLYQKKADVDIDDIIEIM